MNRAWLKKNLANCISALRIVAGAFLYLFNDISIGFLALYIVCFITDLIDGPIARKTGTTSSLGVLLDTLGDAVTYMAFIKIILVKKYVPDWFFYWMIIGVLGIHLIAGLVSLVKVKKFYIVHSLFGKILGGSVFVLPFAMHITGALVGVESALYFQTIHVLFTIIGVFASIAGIESLAVQIVIPDPETRVKTIYQLIRKKY